MQTQRRVTLAAILCSTACVGHPDGSPNILPTLPEAGPVDLAPVPDLGDGGLPSLYPATYRFQCLHIHKLGEVAPDGTPPAQAGILNNLWQSDISRYRLNILIGIEAFDDVSNIARTFIASGVGLDDLLQCREPTTDSVRFDSPVEFGEPQFAPAPMGELTTCAIDGAGTEALGTTRVVVPAESAVYIYAQDENNTTFNCTPDEALPQAVPLRHVRADATISSDTGRLTGELKACLTASDIANLCSCIGACAAIGPDDVQPSGSCGGCPKGAIPLGVQLAGLRSSPACEALVGGDAYELVASFNAQRLPGVPEVCMP
ncbi:MAG: hypothetical protein EXR76_12840 [Myxococcales bacterium]|nr:hypothetical protein [Myxococcales bacterium]